MQWFGGAARGITVPTNLTMLWSSLQQLLQEMGRTGGVAVDGSFFQSLFNGLVKEGEIQGSVRAGVHWTPAAFANEAKGYDSGRLNESNEMASDAGANKHFDKGSKKKKRGKPLEMQRQIYLKVIQITRNRHPQNLRKPRERARIRRHKHQIQSQVQGKN
ncbi:hypothetical protein S83_019573 [Arachis hypogaea]|nr:uncharacterized protein DS421_6g187680 [Arachis hypogaea]